MKRFVLPALIALFAVLGTAPDVLWAGIRVSTSWTAINSGLPGTAAAVAALVVDPTNPSTIYALTPPSSIFSGGIFRSSDGGGSWTAISSVSGIGSLVIDPNNSATIYAATNHGVVKSRDGGASWAAANTGLTGSFVLTLAIAPAAASTLYAVTYDGVFESTDGAASWNAIGGGLAAFRNLPPSSLTIDPVTPSSLYAVTGNGAIFKSEDGGGSWSMIKSAVSAGFAATVLSLAIDPVTPSTIYAGSFATFDCCPGRAGISKSIDGGRTWRAVHDGIPSGAFVRSVVIDPGNPSTVYGAYVSDTSWGIIKSTNRGESWRVINSGLPSVRGNGSLAVAPTTPSTIYSAYFVTDIAGAGVFKSTDGGASWNETDSGLVTINVRVLMVDPLNSSTVYAGMADTVFKTTDSGTSWNKLSTFQIGAPAFPPGLPPPPFGSSPAIVRSLAIDSASSNILYAETARANGCAFSDRLVFKSIDGGMTWDDSVSPDKSGCVLNTYPGVGPALLLTDPGHATTIYLAETEDEDLIYGLLKSTDGGANWSTLWGWGNDLIAGVEAMVIDPKNSSTLYTGIGAVPGGPCGADPTTDTPNSGGVFKTTDGGTTWSRTGLGCLAVNLLAIDPANSNILYAATEGSYSTRGFSGLFKSTDGGASWFALNNGLDNLLDRLSPMTALIIDPSDSSVLYAGMSGGGVLKSSDGGASWRSFNDGLTNLDIRVLAIAPGDPETLYAAGSGGVFAMSLIR